MSRIGSQPIQLADGVQVTCDAQAVLVKGAHGELGMVMPKEVKVRIEEKTLFLDRSSNSSDAKALHGLTRSLLNNAIVGVQKPWEKKLEVIGTGYRVKLQGKDLVFELGFSHPVKFVHVEGIKFDVQTNIVTISGVDKQFVGEMANKIKSVRKPDPYKGKGIRYAGEIIKLKPGKKAKTA